MSYFDPKKETEIIVDASPVGQEGKVVSYASQALSDVESRYSQTKREMLACNSMGSRTFSSLCTCVWGQVFNCHLPQATTYIKWPQADQYMQQQMKAKTQYVLQL